MEKFLDRLNTKTVGDAPSFNIDKLSSPTHLMQKNKEVLEQIDLVNRATLRDGSPMPNEMVIKTVTINESTTKFTILRPEKGEVFRLQQMSLVRTAGSGTTQFYVQYYDGTNEASAIYASTGGTELILTSDDNYREYNIDNSVYFVVYRSSGTATYDLIATFARIR
jgi:hypothetical protein